MWKNIKNFAFFGNLEDKINMKLTDFSLHPFWITLLDIYFHFVNYLCDFQIPIGKMNLLEMDFVWKYEIGGKWRVIIHPYTKKSPW